MMSICSFYFTPTFIIQPIKKDAEESAKTAAQGAKEPGIVKVENPFAQDAPVRGTKKAAAKKKPAAKKSTAKKKSDTVKTVKKGEKKTAAKKEN